MEQMLERNKAAFAYSLLKFQATQVRLWTSSCWILASA
jgi:hypothetical protein